MENTDLLKFPEGANEVVRFMDYIEGSDEEKMKLLMQFVLIAVTN